MHKPSTSPMEVNHTPYSPETKSSINHAMYSIRDVGLACFTLVAVGSLDCSSMRV